MVKCLICNKEFKKINAAHLNVHNTNFVEYLKKFPNAKLTSEEIIQKIKINAIKRYKDPKIRKLISITTKAAMADPTIRAKCAWKRTKHNNEVTSRIIKTLHKAGKYKHIYNKDRNKKISNGKKNWWSCIEEKDRSKLMKSWLKDYLGSEQHIINARKAAVLGFLANANKNESEPEKMFAKFLDSRNIHYEKQYVLDNKFFDFYIPESKLLVEIDGEFYHPLNLEECKYDFQIRNYYNDIEKNSIAQKYNLTIKRIRV